MALVRARPLFSPATPARAVPADCGIGAGGAAGCFHFYCVRGSCRIRNVNVRDVSGVGQRKQRREGDDRHPRSRDRAPSSHLVRGDGLRCLRL